jgi:phytoene dehydrogenase-like protein
MAPNKSYDAVVVGSGPNGLAAAIAIAQAGKSVAVFEANDQLGGGVRSAELTLPGFVHDLCSAVYPLGIGSPFFRTLPLAAFGLEWIQPPAPLAHPLDGGRAMIVERSVEATAARLGSDGAQYQKLFYPFVANWNRLEKNILRPLQLAQYPAQLLRFGASAIQPARHFGEASFQSAPARALIAGLAAHSMLPLERWGSAAFAMVMGVTAHALGWPIVRGGAQRLSDALAAYLRSLGGEIFLQRRIVTLEDLPSARAVLCDVTPRQLLEMAHSGLSLRYRRRLQNFRYGMAAFKIDWALSAAVPWKAVECNRAATVHLGGIADEIACSERAAWLGDPAGKPFVLVVQPSLFDSTRAPKGKHTLWAYCHVPNGSDFDMTEAIEAQIERFAPGFRDTILARCVSRPTDLQQRNANLVGGDINGGAPTLDQIVFRPTYKLYSTSKRGLYLCSASTPPGGGVHGLCGYFAAKRALREVF